MKQMDGSTKKIGYSDYKHKMITVIYIYHKLQIKDKDCLIIRYSPLLSLKYQDILPFIQLIVN